MGRVLLATLAPDDARARLHGADRRKLTPHTLTDVEALLAEISRVRAQGYSIIDQELELGLLSIAVPVYGADGHVVAAINCGSHVSRFKTEDLASRVLPRLIEAQNKLRSVLVSAGH